MYIKHIYVRKMHTYLYSLLLLHSRNDPNYKNFSLLDSVSSLVITLVNQRWIKYDYTNVGILLVFSSGFIPNETARASHHQHSILFWRLICLFRAFFEGEIQKKSEYLPQYNIKHLFLCIVYKTQDEIHEIKVFVEDL